MHTHIFPDKVARKATLNVVDYFGLPEPPNHFGTVDELTAVLDDAGIDYALVFSAATTPRQVEGVNRYILEQTASHRKLLPCGTLHAGFEGFREELRWMREHGIFGVKIHPEFQHFVLDDPRRVTHFARMKERQFAAYINQKNSKELRREMNTLQKELDAMRKRDGELSMLFKRLYEDHVLQRITAGQFQMLSADYNAEQKMLQEAIPEKEDRLEKLKASAANVEAFIEKAKRFTTIDELTPELVRLFIQRIEIGERSVK